MKLLTAFLTLTLASLPLTAQDAGSAQSELNTLRESVIDALDHRDVDRLLPLLHPNVVITFQNGEAARGREGVKAFLLKAITGPERIVDSLHVEAKPDGATILYGPDFAVAAGSSAEELKMARGNDLSLNGRWTATLVKTDGRWLVAALHNSTNLFENPLIAATKKAGVTASIGSLLIGLVAGWFLGRKRVL